MPLLRPGDPEHVRSGAGYVPVMRIGSLLVVFWLVIGLIAAVQRGYFGDDPEVDCASVGTIAVTVLAGPLNYVGVNPKVDDCTLPEPSE